MTRLQIAPGALADLARRLFGPENKRLSTARELRFGRRGSLSVDPQRGVFRDHEVGTGGGVMAMMVHAGAARSLAEAAGILEACGDVAPRESPAERHRREAEHVADLRRRTGVARLLWAAAGPLAATPAETYLQVCRRILAPLDGARLRYHPAAPFHPMGPPGSDTRPAMVAAVENATGEITGAHVTFLRLDGSGKADVRPNRKMIGAVSGGFVRLCAPNKPQNLVRQIDGKIQGPGGEDSPSNITGNDKAAVRYVVGEGLETAISAWEAAGGCEAGCGALAALSAGGLARLNWPVEAAELVIAADRDNVGEEAAQLLARRAHAAGLAVAFMRPPIDCGDWNDWARREGVAR